MIEPVAKTRKSPKKKRKHAYARMIGVLAERIKRAAKKRKRPPIEDKPWTLYVLECCDGSFYTGITNDLEARVAKHNAGKGAAYTRTHRPVKLIYQENGMNRSQALVREFQVKALGRKGKEKLLLSASAALDSSSQN